MNKKVVLGIAVLLILVLVGVGIFRRVKNKQDKVAIRIGAILPLTGKQSAAGEYEKKGILMAYDSISKIYENVELYIEDFASDQKNAITCVNKLIQIDRVDAIITSSTAAAEAITPIIEKNKIIHFAISPDADISQISKYNFRIYYNLQVEASIINSFLINSNIKNVSILCVDYVSFRKQVDNLIVPVLKANGIKISSLEYLDFNNPDYQTAILKIKHSNPDIILLFPQMNQINTIVDKFKELDINPKNIKIMGGFIFNWKPKSYLENLNSYFILAPIFQLKGTVNKISSLYYKKYNVLPNFDAMYSYDNLMILTELLLKSNKKIEIFTKLFNDLKQYEGASGLIKFSGNRDTEVEVIISKIEDGKYIIK